MAHLMLHEDPEHSNTTQSGALLFTWLDPSIATGEFDFSIMDPPAAMDNGLSLNVAAPDNLVGAGTQLGPRQPLHTPVPLYPFQDQPNVLPAIGGSSIATPFAYNAPPQNPGYLPDPWYMQSSGALSSNPYATPVPVQFPQHYPQPVPFPQWDESTSRPSYYQSDGSSLSSNGQNHTSAMAAAPPSTLGNFRGPGLVSAASSCVAPRTGTKRWMSAELAEDGARDVTTSKYARLEGHGPRNNEGRLKCSPLGDVSANVQNTDLVATSRAVEPEYVRPIAGKKRGSSTKQSAAAASPAGIPIRTTGGVSFAPVHVIPLKEENVASPDQKEPTPTSDSSPSREPAVPNALGLSNVPAPVAADEPVRVVEETVVASTGSSSPKPQATALAAVISARVRSIVPLPACDCPDGCISATATTELIEDASGAQDSRDVSDSPESVVDKAVTPADNEVLPVVSDEDAYLFRDLFPDVTGADTATESESSIAAGSTASSSSSQPSAGSSVPSGGQVNAPVPDSAINSASAIPKPMFTTEQEAVLQRSFEAKGPYLREAERNRLSQLLGLTEKDLRAWYTSCRAARKPKATVAGAFVRGFFAQKPDANGKFTAQSKVRLGKDEDINKLHDTHAA